MALQLSTIVIRAQRMMCELGALHEFEPYSRKEFDY